MGTIKVTREPYEKSPGPSLCVSRSQAYAGRGLERVGTRSLTSESDYANELYERRSPDNGRTWGAWKDVHKASRSVVDDRESGRIELYVTKLGADREDFWRSDAYRYLIEVPR